jgi:hypothetical protein
MLPVVWDGISDPLDGVDRYPNAFALRQIPTVYLVWCSAYGAQFCRHVCRTGLVPRSRGHRLFGDRI